MTNRLTENPIRPDYPQFGPTTQSPRRTNWLLYRRSKTPNGPHAVSRLTPFHQLVVIAISILSAYLIGQATHGMSNLILWPCIGLIVGWGLMLEHGLVAIYFSSGLGVGIGQFVGSQFAEHSYNALSAVCIGTCIGIMIIRRMTPRARTAV